MLNCILFYRILYASIVIDDENDDDSDDEDGNKKNYEYRHNNQVMPHDPCPRYSNICISLNNI